MLWYLKTITTKFEYLVISIWYLANPMERTMMPISLLSISKNSYKLVFHYIKLIFPIFLAFPDFTLLVTMTFCKFWGKPLNQLLFKLIWKNFLLEFTMSILTRRTSILLAWIALKVELVSNELNHFGVIAVLFRQIGVISSRFVLFCSLWRHFTIKVIKSVKVFPFSFWKIITKKGFFTS